MSFDFFFCFFLLMILARRSLPASGQSVQSSLGMAYVHDLKDSEKDELAVSALALDNSD